MIRRRFAGVDGRARGRVEEHFPRPEYTITQFADVDREEWGRSTAAQGP